MKDSNITHNDLYKLCFNNIKDIIIVIDLDFRVILASRSVKQILGYDPNEIIGTAFLDLPFIVEQYKGKCRDDLHVLGTGYHLDKEEYLFCSKDNSYKIIDISGMPLYDNDNNMYAFMFNGKDMTEARKSDIHLKATVQNLRRSMKTIIDTLSYTVEAKDPYTAGHQKRVSDLARSLSEELGLSKNVIDGIRMASIIHDIGKIFIPSEILCKPGKLHKTEFELIKIHPKIGFNIVSNIEFDWPVAAIILQHHERNDGSGYPFGIKEKHILKEAKILAIADAVEAQVSHRPYRASLGIETAFAELRNENCKYDTEMVDACEYLFKKKHFMFNYEREM